MQYIFFPVAISIENERFPRKFVRFVFGNCQERINGCLRMITRSSLLFSTVSASI